VSNVFGWDYPAGEENDPHAPWNQKDEEELTVEEELEEAHGKINRLKHSLNAAKDEIARLNGQTNFLCQCGGSKINNANT